MEADKAVATYRRLREQPPTHGHRFFELLRNQSHQNLAALSKTLLLAHRTIIERMEEAKIEEVRHF